MHKNTSNKKHVIAKQTVTATKPKQHKWHQLNGDE
jgi:hypothetical protein